MYHCNIVTQWYIEIYGQTMISRTSAHTWAYLGLGQPAAIIVWPLYRWEGKVSLTPILVSWQVVVFSLLLVDLHITHVCCIFEVMAQESLVLLLNSQGFCLTLISFGEWYLNSQSLGSELLSHCTTVPRLRGAWPMDLPPSDVCTSWWRSAWDEFSRVGYKKSLNLECTKRWW